MNSCNALKRLIDLLSMQFYNKTCQVSGKVDLLSQSAKCDISLKVTSNGLLFEPTNAALNLFLSFGENVCTVIVILVLLISMFHDGTGTI